MIPFPYRYYLKPTVI